MNETWQWIGATVGLLAVALFLFTRFYLRGADLRHYDAAPLPAPLGGEPPSPVLREIMAWLVELFSSSHQIRPLRQRILHLRRVMDQMGDGFDNGSCVFQPVADGGVRGEWVLAPGADPTRRLLYIHGGAWAMGSPRSHRAITVALAQRTGAAVFAVDYRLVPEHSRLVCLEDCQQAYGWLVTNGPQGLAPARSMFVAGDSAGGNLTLALLAWARDAGLQTATAAVALAPVTDGTLSGLSVETNLASDHMLGPLFAPLVRMPRFLLLWSFWLATWLRPCDPRLSPIHGELGGLPPLLVHVSASEMLLDDARRYVAKAQAAGSPARLETWANMLHVWHIFAPRLPEAEAALDRIAAFLSTAEQHRAQTTA